MAGAGASSSSLKEQVPGSWTTNPNGLGVKGKPGMVLMWTVKEPGRIERPGGRAKPRAKEASEVQDGGQDRGRKNNRKGRAWTLWRTVNEQKEEKVCAPDTVPSSWPNTEPECPFSAVLCVSSNGVGESLSWPQISDRDSHIIMAWPCT